MQGEGSRTGSPDATIPTTPTILTIPIINIDAKVTFHKEFRNN